MRQDTGVAEAAARKIPDEATRPADRLGDLVVAYARAHKADFPDTPRDRTPIEPADIS